MIEQNKLLYNYELCVHDDGGRRENESECAPCSMNRQNKGTKLSSNYTPSRSKRRVHPGRERQN